MVYSSPVRRGGARLQLENVFTLFVYIEFVAYEYCLLGILSGSHVRVVLFLFVHSDAFMIH